MMNILIYADKLDVIRELITAAASFDVAATPKVFAATDELAQEAASYAESYSAGNVPVQDAHSTAAAISQAARALNCDVVMLLADRIGKDLAGHLAQATGAGALTGVTAFGQNHSAFRCALGGAVVEESVIESDAKIFAIAPKSFALAEQSASSAAKIDIEILQPSVVVKSVEPKAGGRADVAAADVVIAVGCGFEDEADMAAVEQLAEKLNAAIGCTKPLATDRKWFPEDCIIGISGKTCRPSLAISIGISGQVQYWAGIRDAGLAIAINSDKNAAIVPMCDASVVMDGSAAVAELNSKLP